MQRIFNKDNFNWWIGVVEDRFDPEQLGRVRARIFGYHTEDKILLPTKDLPWAIPIHDIHSAASSGIGNAPLGPLHGSWIIGFFLDGEDMQQPAFFGCIGTKSAPQVFVPKDDKPPVANVVDGILKDGNGNPVLDAFGNPVRVGAAPIPGWKLGNTSEYYEKFETDTGGLRGANYITLRYNDQDHPNSRKIEGACYGAWAFVSHLPQFTPFNKARPSAKTNQVTSYLKTSKFSTNFEGLTPGTSDFDSVWGSLPAQEFLDDQYNYIKKSYYEIMVSNLESVGFDAKRFGPAVQDLIWSTSFHYGPYMTQVFTIPLADKSKLSDKDIVNMVCGYKNSTISTYFGRRGPVYVAEVTTRLNDEKEKLLGLVG